MDGWMDEGRRRRPSRVVTPVEAGHQVTLTLFYPGESLDADAIPSSSSVITSPRPSLVVSPWWRG